MTYTPQQQKIITTENQPLIVEAGAGTGKTYSLVERFIYLLEQHPDWSLESIIAITFTIKAAREMRSRVRTAIERHALAAPPDSFWHQHRRNLDRMQISTIHSLCATILRENAIAAQIDPKFEVIDEAQSDLLRETAVRETIKSIVAENHPALELLDTLHVHDLRSEMLNLISQRGILRLLFEQLPDEQGLLEQWQAGMQSMRTALWEQQRIQNPALVEAIHDLPSVSIRDHQDKLSSAVGLAKQGCQALAENDIITACNLWGGMDLRGGKKDNWGGETAKGELVEALKALKAAAITLYDAGTLQDVGENDQQAAYHLQLWRHLWDQLNLVYDRLKDEQQLMDFDDLEYQTHKLLILQPQPARLKAFLDGIKHLMVDEFQDTNPVQVQIVKALAPIEEGSKLFTVGDAKQSIYRFRQAQVSIFNKTAQEITSVTHTPPLPLNTSFRAHHRLVTALNDLFEHILTPAVGTSHKDFEARPGPLVAHRSGEPAPQPCVEVMLLPTSGQDNKKISTEDTRIAEAAWIAQRIHQLYQQKTQIWDQQNHVYCDFEYRDAAVLFRATTDMILYEAEFKAAGVPYLTASGRGYYDRPEVQDLIALLYALLNPLDDLNLAAALRSPLFMLNDETLYRLRWFTPSGELSKDPIPYSQALLEPPTNEQADWVQRAAHILQTLWGLSGRTNVWSLLRKALDLTAFEALLAINDGENGRQLSNVQKFTAQARDRMDVTLADFLAQLRDLKQREAREGEALGREPASGAVQLMSVHAAKGLEFPVVFVADFGRQLGGRTSTPYILHDPEFGMVCKVRNQAGEWVKDPYPAGYAWAKWLNDLMDAAEMRRLLYVAATRAADLLIFSGGLGSNKAWMPAVLDAWGIAPLGEEEEVLPREGYHIKVLRPTTLPETIEAAGVQPQAGTSLAHIPALAKAYGQPQKFVAVGATDLAEMLYQGKSELAQVRPVVWQQDHMHSPDHVPGYILGNIVHHILSRNYFEQSSHPDLSQKLDQLARQEGLSGAAAKKAVMRSQFMLTQLTHHPLYQAIKTAKAAWFELPFSWSSPLGNINGVIDVLYQDQTGVWHLLDWKTDYLTPENLPELKQRYTIQLSLYQSAVSDILAITPQVELAFLNPRVELLPIKPVEIDFNTLLGGV